MVFKFSPITTHFLQLQGWSEDRKIDTSEYEKHLREIKQPISELILAFLASFGGMKFYEAPCENPETCDEYELFWIDPLAFTVWGAERRRSYNSWIEKPFCSIGGLGHGATL